MEEQSLPREEEQVVEKFVKDAKENELLKKNGIIVVKKEYYKLLKILVFFFVVFILGFLYFTYEGKFLPEIFCGSTNVSCGDCPDCNCPSSPACNPTIICNATSNSDCSIPEYLKIYLNTTIINNTNSS